MPRLIDAPGDDTHESRTTGDEIFCRCRICDSRWRVVVTREYDGGSADTLYAWEESSWDDAFLQARQYEALYESRQKADRKKTEEYYRQRNPHAGPAAPSAGDAASAPEPVVERPSDLEWRWVDERGIVRGCRIDGTRVSVWTESPLGGDGTDCSLTDLLDGRLAGLLPSAIAGEVRGAARRAQNAAGSIDPSERE